MDQTTWAWCTILKVTSHSPAVPTKTAKSRVSPKVRSTHLLALTQQILNYLKTISVRQLLIQRKLNSLTNSNNLSLARVPPKKKKTLKMETALKRTPNSKRINPEKPRKRNPRIKNRNSWVTWLPCILILCTCFIVVKEVTRYLLACHQDSYKECRIHQSIRSRVCLSMELSPAPCILLSVTPQGKEPVISKLDNITEVVQQCSLAIKISLFCQSHQITWRTSNCLARNPCSPHLQETLQKVADQIKDWDKELGLIRIRLLRIIFWRPLRKGLKILDHCPTKTVRPAKTRQRRSTFRYTRDQVPPKMPSASHNRRRFRNSIITSPWWSITLDLRLRSNNCLVPIRKTRTCPLYPRRKRQSVTNWNLRRKCSVLYLPPSRYLQIKRTWLPNKMVRNLENPLDQPPTPNSLSDLWASDNSINWKISATNSRRR